jgi:hypothetical protein
MRFIAHRGNYKGPQKYAENTKQYLEHAYFDMGFDVECDLIAHNGNLYLGHDNPGEMADPNFLQRDGVWCHAKNLEALELLLAMRTNCFWHEKDTVTLTSQKYIWCYPGVLPVHPRAVWLDLEDITLPKTKYGIYAICGDIHR